MIVYRPVLVKFRVWRTYIKIMFDVFQDEHSNRSVRPDVLRTQPKVRPPAGVEANVRFARNNGHAARKTLAEGFEYW